MTLIYVLFSLLIISMLIYIFTPDSFKKQFSEEWEKLQKKELDNKIISQVQVEHISGIPDLSQNVKCKVLLKKDKLIINDKHIIKLANIKSTEVVKSRELLNKKKSVLGRALIGGALLGGVGAVVGGMTALQNEKESKDVDLLIINYKNTKNELSQIIFMGLGIIQSIPIKDFSNNINNLIGYKQIISINKQVEI